MSNAIENKEQCRLENKIGEGSFGTVYRITCGDKKYALKVQKEIKSLSNEIRVLMSLNHPSIPRLLDYGISDGYAYIVIPLLHISLTQIRERCPSFFTPCTVASIGLSILGTLQYLHEQGFVYRDIKPENIMVGYDNKIYLIEFGMCYSYRADGQHIKNARVGQFVGTMRYASLNTHRGETQSRRDDLESLAYVLIFLVKGELPWCTAEKLDKLEVARVKSATSAGDLAAGLQGSAHWERFLEIVKKLEFAEEPSYPLLQSCLVKTGEKPDPQSPAAPPVRPQKHGIWHAIKNLFSCC